MYFYVFILIYFFTQIYNFFSYCTILYNCTFYTVFFKHNFVYGTFCIRDYSRLVLSSILVSTVDVPELVTGPFILYTAKYLFILGTKYFADYSNAFLLLKLMVGKIIILCFHRFFYINKNMFGSVIIKMKVWIRNHLNYHCAIL